jgi:hypothetical protein
MANFNLEGYVTVAERLTQAHDQIVTVVTEPPILLTDVMGFIRATVALQDGRSATATASFRLDLQNRSAQATNPLEDCETSAIGRALGFLGYGSSKSIASREEVQEAHRRSDSPATYNQPRTPVQAPQKPAPQAVATNGAPPLCPVHGKPMREGKNGGYFCATKLDDGSWCKARPEKPAADTAEWDAIDSAPSARRRQPVAEDSLL